MRETEIIARIRQLAGKTKSTRLLTAIGDDCAIFRPRPGEDLVFTTDLTIQGRHFQLDSHRATDIGHLALARSLSDLAAMGAEPAFCLVSLALPAELSTAWLKRFYTGLLALARKSNVGLAGGDLSRFDQVVVDVMCCGRVPRGKALTRSGAKPGDVIYVTGSLGASELGLETRTGDAWKRHLRPQPRLAAGVALRKIPATSAMDLSDGLSLDLHRLSLESGVSAQLDETIPVAIGATLEQALHGGEDYELLFTARTKSRVPPQIDGLSITRIGEITRGKPGAVRYGKHLLKPLAFDHFS
ncbi:MAG: thiamine-phosphate kinase [Bryobacteraceae bacterium]